MPRCLILVTTTSYRTEAFLEAARRIGVEVVIGSDRCRELAKRWPDEAFRGSFDASIRVDFRRPRAAAKRIAEAAAARPFDAVVASDDATAVVAAMASEELGLKGNAPDAVYAAHNKAEMRARLHARGVPSPRYLVFAMEATAGEVATGVRAAFGFPCVAKPLLLSASRGVIRCDDEAAVAAALPRVCALLRRRPEYADGTDRAARQLLVEEFVPGVEVALEGILAGGALRTLAIYDKPDPLDGPYFEETIYVTPSRLPEATQRGVERVAAAAAAAIGLREGPIHAELRVAAAGPMVIEVAARSIGGLCARTLRYTLGGDADCALEEVVLRHALGRGSDEIRGQGGAAGVMMLPIPAAGVLQEVTGVEEAKRVSLIEDVVLTIRPGERLVPLPEGASYPGFIFARGAEAAPVERALREAHARLHFKVAPLL